MKNRILLLLSLCIVLVSVSSTFGDEKLSANEIVQKHLDSIGSKAKRDEVKNLLIMSDLQFASKGSATPVSGKAVFASEGSKNIWGMILTSNDYPQEKFGFNGENIQVAFVRPGVYSLIGEFLNSYKTLLKDGLMGGALFSSWALYDIPNRQPKLSNVKNKKFGDMETYSIEYQPKGNSDLEIKMFFDTKTFRHVRTEYLKIIAAQQAGTTGSLSSSEGARLNTTDIGSGSAGQGSDRYQVIEEYSDFQNMNGLTLPGTYKLSYSYYNGSTSQGGKRRPNSNVEWKFKVTGFSYNQELDPNSFTIESK